MKKIIFVLSALLLAGGVHAEVQNYEVTVNSSNFNGEILMLKKAMKNQHPEVNLNRSKLIAARLTVKNISGKSVAASLVQGNTFRSSSFEIPYQPDVVDRFKNQWGSTMFTLPGDDSHRTKNNGAWQIHFSDYNAVEILSVKLRVTEVAQRRTPPRGAPFTVKGSVGVGCKGRVDGFEASNFQYETSAAGYDIYKTVSQHPHKCGNNRMVYATVRVQVPAGMGIVKNGILYTPIRGNKWSYSCEGSSGWSANTKCTIATHNN